MSDLNIFIPSYRRLKVQTTFEYIPSQWSDNVFLVVDENDYSSYRKRWGHEVVLKCPEKGISKTRQWIIENCESKYALMLDDDMEFFIRKEGISTVRCQLKDISKMFELLESWLDEGLIHVGISQKFGNNRIESDFTEITRMNNAYAYNVNEMVKLKRKYQIGFDYIENKYNKRLVMEDFQVTLSLLQLGFKNRVTFKFCWSQRQSGDEGGCSLYRNDEMQKTSALIIAKEFPGIATPVQKISNKKWKGFKSKERTDLHISWKKIFNTGRHRKITEFI